MNVRSPEQKKRHSEYLKAWTVARLELQRLIESYENFAEMESSWEGKHPPHAARADEDNPATKALQLVKEQYKYPAPMAPVDAVNSSATQQKKAKKTVGFTADTDFSPRRNRHEYWRNSDNTSYASGRYTATSSAGFIVTSRFKDPEYAAHQCKVVVTASHADFRAYQEKPNSIPAFDQPNAFPKLWTKIGRYIEESIQGGLKSRWKEAKGLKEQLYKLCERSDGIAVLLNYRKRVQDMAVLYAQKDEFSGRLVQAGEWVSLHDAMS